MTYRTQGTIATIKWRKDNRDGTDNPDSDSLSFTLDPIAPYLFEENDGGKTKKFLLLVEAKARTVLKKKDATKTDFIADFREPSMSFAALLLLKQNRSKVEIEIDVKDQNNPSDAEDNSKSKSKLSTPPSKSSDATQPKDEGHDSSSGAGAVAGNDGAAEGANDAKGAKRNVAKPNSSTTDEDGSVYTVVKFTVK